MSGQLDGKRIYDGRIIRDREICGSDPVFKCTCVTLRTVLAGLASGERE
ncbi:MAG: hypothetical protein WBE73_11445 [Candidatus Acidiferrum sp.]|jgi:hypothetical protein